MATHTLHHVEFSGAEYIVRRLDRKGSISWTAWEPTSPGRHAVTEQFEGRPYGKVSSRIPPANVTEKQQACFCDVNEKLAATLVKLAQ